MRCGAADATVRHRAEIVDFKGLTLEVEGLADTLCNACQYTWTTDGQEADNLAILRAAFAERRDVLRAEEGLLTGEQIDRALHSLSLNRAQASTLLGGGPNAFARYICGDVLQSFAMDRLIRLTVAFGDDAVQFLRTAATQPLALNAGVRQMTTTVVISTNAGAIPRGPLQMRPLISPAAPAEVAVAQ